MIFLPSLNELWNFLNMEHPVRKNTTSRVTPKKGGGGAKPHHNHNRRRLRHLPEKLIFTHILPRLPAKSIGRCSCVSKSWLLFLSSNEFTNNIHLSHASSYPFSITSDSRSIYYFRSRSCCVAFGNHEIISNVYSSLHGLLCAEIYNDLTRATRLRVINPVTQLSFDLPNLPAIHDATVDGIRQGYLCQIVFDQSWGVTGVYKVLVVFRTASSRKLMAHVMTLGVIDKSWRERSFEGLRISWLNDLPLKSPCVNGAFHFLAGRKKTGKIFIAAFDIDSESFREIKPPEEYDGMASLLEIGGFLYMYVVYAENGNGMQRKMWKLEDYEREEWSMIDLTESLLMKIPEYVTYRAKGWVRFPHNYDGKFKRHTAYEDRKGSLKGAEFVESLVSFRGRRVQEVARMWSIGDPLLAR